MGGKSIAPLRMHRSVGEKTVCTWVYCKEFRASRLVEIRQLIDLESSDSPGRCQFDDCQFLARQYHLTPFSSVSISSSFRYQR